MAILASGTGRSPVKATLGPRGRHVIIDENGLPKSTRDGVTVAKYVAQLADPFENLSAQLAKEVADAAVVQAGDGTTTATVLLQAIVHAGMEAIDNGAEPLALADGIKAAAAACVTEIKKLSVEATPEMVRQAAIISTHGNVDLGTMIAEATCKVGANGVLELQESRDDTTTIEHLEGFYFERGWRPYQFYARFDKSGQKCVLKDPYILISERLIVGANPNLDGDHINRIMQKVVEKRRPFLLIAEDLQGDALHFFNSNLMQGNFEGCFVRLPGFGEQRSASIEDLRVAVGAGRIHSQTSTRQADRLSDFTLGDLGQCEQAVISATRTVLINGAADTKQKTHRLKQLIDQSQEAGNPLEKEQLNHRIARLAGGVAVLRVGAHSEPAMLEKKALAEDAIHACRGALEEGLVPGGGVALLRAGLEANDDGPLSLLGNVSPDLVHGYDILLKAIREPAIEIIKNTGHGNPSDVVDALEGNEQVSYGYNAATGKAGCLYSMGIVDPTKVVITALTKAASIAALLLTTEVLATETPSKLDSIAMPVPPGMLVR